MTLLATTNVEQVRTENYLLAYTRSQHVVQARHHKAPDKDFLQFIADCLHFYKVPDTPATSYDLGRYHYYCAIHNLNELVHRACNQ